MPVKWDAEKDKFILNCLLLDPTVNIGTGTIDGICSTWPNEFGDAPTRKAVQEHFFKIRKSNKKFSVGGASIAPATPTKGASKPRPKTPASKRKRNVASRASEEDDDDEVMMSVTKSEVDTLVKKEEVEESPTKRVRTAVKYEEDDDEGAQLSGSEFQFDEV